MRCCRCGECVRESLNGNERPGGRQSHRRRCRATRGGRQACRRRHTAGTGLAAGCRHRATPPVRDATAQAYAPESSAQGNAAARVQRRLALSFCRGDVAPGRRRSVAFAQAHYDDLGSRRAASRGRPRARRQARGHQPGWCPWCPDAQPPGGLCLLRLSPSPGGVAGQAGGQLRGRHPGGLPGRAGGEVERQPRLRGPFLGLLFQAPRCVPRLSGGSWHTALQCWGCTTRGRVTAPRHSELVQCVATQLRRR
jgi:hypothetical protein